MCQYSAVDGSMTDWHLAHLGMLANSGAALLCFEMTDGRADRRITPGCSGVSTPTRTKGRSAASVRHCRAHGQAKLAFSCACGPEGFDGRTLGGEKDSPPRGGRLAAGRPVAIPMGEGEPVPRALARARSRRSSRSSPIGAPRRANRFRLRRAAPPRTVICCTSFSRRSRTGATIRRLARNRMPLSAGSRRRDARAWPGNKRSACACPARTGWKAAGTSSRRCLRRELKKLGCDLIDLLERRTGEKTGDPRRARIPGAVCRANPKDAVSPQFAIGDDHRSETAENIVAEGKADMVSLARGISLGSPLGAGHGGARLGVTPCMPSQ